MSVWNEILRKGIHLGMLIIPIGYHFLSKEIMLIILGVLVLLALLSLGVKNIMLGPTLPAFISPNVLNVLVEKFHISPNSSVEQDMNKLVAGIPAY